MLPKSRRLEHLGRQAASNSDEATEAPLKLSTGYILQFSWELSSPAEAKGLGRGRLRLQPKPPLKGQEKNQDARLGVTMVHAIFLSSYM